MAWTTPATAVDGTVLTAAFWNLHVRDQLLALGIDTIQEGEIIQGVSPGVIRNVDGAALAAQPGTILDYPGTSPPSGYIACDGALVSRTTYADLFAAIGTIFGSGAGALYALDTGGNLYRVDLSDVNNPILLGDLGSGDRWSGLGNIGTTLYILDQDGNLYQADQFPNPTLLGTLMGASSTWQGLGNIGNTLYSLESNGNLYQVDLTDISNPTLLGDVGNGIWFGLGDIGTTLYVMRDGGNLYQVDLTDISNPTLLGNLGSGDRWFGLGNIGTTLYVMTNTGTLYQVDLSDVGNPILLGYLGSGGWSGLGGFVGASNSFQLPNISPSDSRLIAVIKT